MITLPHSLHIQLYGSPLDQITSPNPGSYPPVLNTVVHISYFTLYISLGIFHTRSRCVDVTTSESESRLSRGSLDPPPSTDRFRPVVYTGTAHCNALYTTHCTFCCKLHTILHTLLHATVHYSGYISRYVGRCHIEAVGPQQSLAVLYM